MCAQILENATIKLGIGRKAMEENAGKLHFPKMTAKISSITHAHFPMRLCHSSQRRECLCPFPEIWAGL